MVCSASIFSDSMGTLFRDQYLVGLLLYVGKEKILFDAFVFKKQCPNLKRATEIAKWDMILFEIALFFSAKR